MALFNIFKKKKKEETKSADNTKKSVEVKAEIAEAKKESPAKPSANDVKQNTEKLTKAQDSTPAAAKEEAPAKTAKPAQTETKAETKATDEKSAPKVTEKPESKAVSNNEESAEQNVDIAAEKKYEAASDTKGYTGRFEINKSKDGKKFFFNLYASNKVGIATSQMYSSAQSALIGVKSVIANAADAPIEDQSLKKYETLPYPKWEIYIDNGGKYRFRLNASNGSCVCHSQGYTTKTACKNGIDSIIRSSRNAEIDKTYLTTK